MSDLHERIAKVLGWTPSDVRSLSMQSLRDLVRPVDPSLARELDYTIQSGAYARGEPARRSQGRSARARSSHATKRALPPLKKISTTGGDFNAYLAVHRDPMNDREFRLSWYALDGTGSIGERGLTQPGFRSEGAARAYAKSNYGGEPIRVPAWGVGPDIRKKIPREVSELDWGSAAWKQRMRDRGWKL